MVCDLRESHMAIWASHQEILKIQLFEQKPNFKSMGKPLPGTAFETLGGFEAGNNIFFWKPRFAQNGHGRKCMKIH